MLAMAIAMERRVAPLPVPRQVNWRGRSGRLYALRAERLDRFQLAEDGLFLLARGTLPVWVGSAFDVINDAQSRARFRLALEAADRAFGVDIEVDDDVTRMTMVWDLEGAEPVSGLSAA